MKITRANDEFRKAEAKKQEELDKAEERAKRQKEYQEAYRRIPENKEKKRLYDQKRNQEARTQQGVVPKRRRRPKFDLVENERRSNKVNAIDNAMNDRKVCEKFKLPPDEVEEDVKKSKKEYDPSIIVPDLATQRASLNKLNYLNNQGIFNQKPATITETNSNTSEVKTATVQENQNDIQWVFVYPSQKRG